WQPLTTAPANGQIERIRLGRRAEILRGLRFEARNGFPVISTIELVYVDGRRRFINLDRALDRRSEPVFIALGPNEPPVAEILVYTEPSRGSFRVYGIG